MTWGDLHGSFVQLQPSSRLPGRHIKAHCSHKDGENKTWIWSLFFLHILSHICFRKGLCWFVVWFKHCKVFTGLRVKGLRMEVKSLSRILGGIGQDIVFHNSCYTTLYLLDLFGFEPKSCILYYLKLTIDKRVKWGPLARPSHFKKCMPFKFGNFIVLYLNT